MGKDNLSALAAGAAFQALLAIFPTLTAVVSLYGLVADPNMVERQIAAMQGVLPPEAVKLIATWLEALVQGPATKFGIGLIVSVLLAFWSMWSATGMLMTAVNICYGEEEKRGFVSFNLHALALGAGLALFGVAALALVAVLPAALAFLPVSAAWGDVLGLVRPGVTALIVKIGRWPILFALVTLALAVLYKYGPSRTEPRWRWITWGSVTAAVVWLAASALFSWYVASFGSYNKTYGSLGAIIGFMTWIWISIIVVLVGAKLNAEMEHQTVRESTTGQSKPLGRRGARMADTVGAAQA